MTMHVTNIGAPAARTSSHIKDGDVAPKHFTSASDGGAYRAGLKHVFDVVLILIALPLVLPMIILMAILAIFDGHNPFYSQTRVGQNGKSFRMWKIRTMVPNADALLKTYLANNEAARKEWNATQKLKDDPRITTVGRLLRKTSMDELPQLLNVLNGTMSLVGPRPMMLQQQKDYHGTAYYKLRPGITGLWQTSRRNECDFVDRIVFDDRYDMTMSFKTDIMILLRTIGVVLRGTGY